MGDVAGEKNSGACALFDRFVQAGTCKGTLRAYQDLCELVDLKPSDFRTFYPKLKSKLNYWKAKGLWSKIDKRAAHKDYKKGKQCSNVKCLIIGAGPCGLRSAIELALLGAKVVVVEKRDAFSRNNVLHLWPYTIHDLKALGAKKFHGKFCAGAIDHISIRQLQLILLKVSLLLGVEIHVNVEFKGIMEPPEDQENDRIGWRAEIVPNTHPVAEYEFDVIIGADGHRNTLQGFRRKEFRGKLAIAITANFINRNTTAEAKVEELSGVAFIFNQKFFTDLRASKGIDLENIVYYKDDTHYFVMTAKKQSLLEKGVILQDYPDTEMLLSRENVDQEALQEYARGAADFSTNHQLPSLDFAINHYGQPDVAMFDFTCMYASENAALVRERHGHRLLVALVGDSLLEPFWPMGTGCARGFLAAFDSAWMIRSWAQGTPPLEVLAERESIYRLLPQTTPENINKNFSQYSIDPTTRYPNVNLNFLRASQVRHLYDTGEARETAMDVESSLGADSRLTRHDSIVRSSKLLNWCQRQTEGYRSVRVVDFTGSWKSGLALCAIIHRYRPDLIDFDSLDERNVAGNNQLAFDVAEREFGISPIITGQEVAGVADPDKLSMVMYLSQFYEMFRDTLPPAEYNKLMGEDDRSAALLSTKSPISFLSKLGQTISRKRTPRDKKEKEVDGLGKRRRTGQKASDEEEMQARREDRWGVGNGERRADAVSGNQNKVKSMANQLLAKFEENAPLQSNLKRQSIMLPYMERVAPPPSTRRKELSRANSLPVCHQGIYARAPRVCPKKIIMLGTSPAATPPEARSQKLSKYFLRKWEKDFKRSEKTRPHEQLPAVISPYDQLPAEQQPSISERASHLAALFQGQSDKSQSYIRMYSTGVSERAAQLVSQMQPAGPRPLLDKRELKHLGSLRKEFPQNLGGSDTCYFCGRRVYVMERLSAEGKFFHRGCFKCNYCDVTLRLGAFAFDVEDGKFYCKPHYCYRLSGFMQRKMQRNEMALDVEVGDEEEKPPTRSPSSSQPAPRSPLREPVPGSPNRDALLLSGSAAAMAALASVSSAGTAGASALQPAGAAATAALEEDDAAGGSSSSTGGGGSVPKRTWVTPERIELESGRLSARLVELVEVPEETLAQHNLSGTLERYADMGLGLGDEESSSDSDLSGGEPDCDEDVDDVPLGASAGPARGSAWSSPPRLDRTPSPEPLEWKANPLVDVRVAPSDEAAGPWGGGFPTAATTAATAASYTDDRWREMTKQGPTSPTAGVWADAARERAVPPATSVENDAAKPPSEANGTAVAGGSAEPKPNGGALEPSNSRERCLRLSVETEDQEEEEEEEEAEEEGFSDDDSGSDLGGMPWKEAVKRHEILRGRTAEEAEREAQRLAEEEARNLAEAGEAIALGLVDGYEDGDEEYDDDEEEEEEEEEGDEEDESSDVSRLKLRDKAKPTPVLDVQAPLSAKPPIPGSLQASPTAATVAEEMTSSRNHAVMAWLRATNGAETTATTAAATAAATAGAAGASNRKADEEPRSASPSPGSDLRSGGQAAPWTKHADATAPVNDSMSPPPLPQSQSAEPQDEAAKSPHAPVPGPHDEKATFGGNAHGRRFQGDDILARGTATPALPHLNGLPSVWAELPLNIPSSKTDQAQSLGRKLQCPDLAKGPPLTLPLLPVSTQPKADSGSNCLPSKPLFAPSPPPVSSPNATSAAASKGHEASPRAFFSHSPLGPPPSKYDLLLWGLENPSSVIPPLPPQPPSSSFQPSWLLDANKSPLVPAKELASTGVAAQPHSPLGLAALQSPVTSHAAPTTPSLSKSLFYQSPLLSPLSPIPSTQSPSVILGLSQVSLISPKSFADQASPRSLQSPIGNLEQPRMTAASPAATKPQLGTVSPSAYFMPSSRPIPSPRTQLSPGLVSGLPQVPIVTPRSFMQRAGVSWEQPSNTQKTVTATEKNEKPESEMTHAKDISAGDAGGVFRSTAAEEKDTIDRHRLEAELSWARFGIGGQERRQSPTASDSSGTISTPESARARSPAPRTEPGAGSGTVEPRPENQMSTPARPVVKSAAASKAEWLNTPSSLPASDSLSTALSRNHVAKTVGNGEELNHVDILHPEDVSVCLVEDVHPGAEGEDDPNTSTSLLLTPPSSPPPPPPPNEEPASLFVYRPHTTPPRARPLSLDAHLTPKRSAPSRLQDTLRQKSLEESIDEIPFADEEEDGDDDDEGGSCADFRSPASSVFLDESFHTPPTSRPAGRTRPVFDRDSSSRKTTPCSKISPEAKEVAESRLREREQVVKSNVLRDAMAQQREKLKGRLAGETSFFSSPAYAPHGKKPSTSAVAEAATKPPSLLPSDRHVDSEPARRKHESAKGSKSVKLVDGDALKEESQVDDLPPRSKKKIPAKDLSSETSHTSSEDVPGKSKKRASLFSPRKNKKDKAAKMESQRAADAAALANESNASIAKSRSPLWKVFSHGYRKERRKEKELEERTRSSTTSSVGTVDSATEQPIITATPKPMALHPVLAMRRQASQTEDDSELSSEEVLNDPSCQRGRRRETRDIFDRVQPLLREGQLQFTYVPHALAFKSSFVLKKPYTEEELNEKLTRRVQRAARKQAKQEELKRLHRAQIIQRQLEEVEEKQRALEERGVAVEKALRGEADYWGDTNNTVDIYGLQLVVESIAGPPQRRALSFCPCCSPKRGGLGKKDDPRLMQEWFKLVQEKNTMVRYESELMIFARELELEDRQSRLQQDLRERMAVDDAQKSEAELSEEKRILSEMLDVVEQRDSLVALLEEQRLREREEDRDIEAIMLSRGYTFNWT
ncbi:F-actin-monooxygenase MICAL3 isoform X6 [Lethenteron reissneri]|uniref:F-actin-monooxygenase MICAL3 isoform X6 n=1 Tax=Lethenteron reissneri TaxID=7753 RepID=UPI002AB6224E|nr:F-actin-monooxygenase MICAL3 isoform X6 [Lethenteron reissneri]